MLNQKIYYRTTYVYNENVLSLKTPDVYFSPKIPKDDFNTRYLTIMRNENTMDFGSFSSN